jgi:hypothetical protein
LADAREFTLGTSPLSADSDSDGFADSLEVLYGSNPNDVASTPNTTTPIPLVNLDATALPAGTLTNWHSSNTLAYAFSAPGTGIVETVSGTKGVTFDGDDYYTGPGMPLYLAGNTNWSVEAWIFNPVVGNEETVLAWGRRGGNPDGSNASFIHGNNNVFGAVGLWASADVAWGTNANHIASNTVAGAWTFVAYTHDPANSLVSLFKDGVLVHSEFATNAQGAPLNTHLYDPSDPNNLAPNPVPIGRALPFRVGAQNDAGGNVSGPFPTMTIAKARIYSHTLTAQQIADKYNAEKAQFPGAPNMPIIRDVRVNPTTGIITFDWTPAPGQSYAVEANTNVANAAGWSTIATNQTSGSFTNSASQAQEFYRLRVE